MCGNVRSQLLAAMQWKRLCHNCRKEEVMSQLIIVSDGLTRVGIELLGQLKIGEERKKEIKSQSVRQEEGGAVGAIDEGSCPTDACQFLFSSFSRTPFLFSLLFLELPFSFLFLFSLLKYFSFLFL